MRAIPIDRAAAIALKRVTVKRPRHTGIAYFGVHIPPRISYLGGDIRIFREALS